MGCQIAINTKRYEAGSSGAKAFALTTSSRELDEKPASFFRIGSGLTLRISTFFAPLSNRLIRERRAGYTCMNAAAQPISIGRYWGVFPLFAIVLIAAIAIVPRWLAMW